MYGLLDLGPSKSFEHVPTSAILLLRRLLSFISWVELEHPNITLTDAGCFNPYAQPSITSQGGELAQLKPQSNISGCVPQARTSDGLLDNTTGAF